MTEAQEVRARAKALRERREELEKALAGAAGPGARPLRLELARVKEELVDCARRLKELMPSHKVRCRTTWAGVDGWQWDRFQYQTWAELEGAGEQDGPTELDRMRLAVRLARERAVTDKQGEYLAQVEGGKKAAQVAREAGRHRGTVSRTVGRGRTKIAKEAKALYEVHVAVCQLCQSGHACPPLSMRHPTSASPALPPPPRIGPPVPGWDRRF